MTLIHGGRSGVISQNANVQTIGMFAFFGNNSLHEVVIPGSVRSIERSAFEGSSLARIFISSSVERIGKRAFRNCHHLELVYFGSGSSLYYLGEFAFENNYILRRIEIPYGIEYLRRGTFSHAVNLREVVLPNSLRKIYNNAFGNCHSLRVIRIPNSVEEIMGEAFWGCVNLSVVLFEEGENNQVMLYAGAFVANDNLRMIVVPCYSFKFDEKTGLPHYYAHLMVYIGQEFNYVFVTDATGPALNPPANMCYDVWRWYRLTILDRYNVSEQMINLLSIFGFRHVIFNALSEEFCSSIISSCLYGVVVYVENADYLSIIMSKFGSSHNLLIHSSAFATDGTVPFFIASDYRKGYNIVSAFLDNPLSNNFTVFYICDYDQLMRWGIRHSMTEKGLVYYTDFIIRDIYYAYNMPFHNDTYTQHVFINLENWIIAGFMYVNIQYIGDFQNIHIFNTTQSFNTLFGDPWWLDFQDEIMLTNFYLIYEPIPMYLFIGMVLLRLQQGYCYCQGCFWWCEEYCFCECSYCKFQALEFVWIDRFGNNHLAKAFFNQSSIVQPDIANFISNELMNLWSWGLFVGCCCNMKEDIEDIRVLQAIKHAVNLYYYFGDFVVWASDPCCCNDWSWSPIQFNPDRANELLDEAGFVFGGNAFRTMPDGSSFELVVMLYSDVVIAQMIATIFVQYMFNIGINVNMIVIEV